MMSLTTASPYVTTNTATNVSSASATVNGTNGSSAADNTSFWWGTTFAGPFVAGENATEFPLLSGWTHDNGLGSASIGGSFNENLAGLSPNTTYYYAAWSLVGGIWYPGDVLTFATPAVVIPAPTVTSVAPVSGPAAGGTTVTVTGTNLTGTIAVDFGETPATNVVVADDGDSLTATAPAGTGTVNVTVTTPGGTSATNEADQFTYVSNALLNIIVTVDNSAGGSATPSDFTVSVIRPDPSTSTFPGDALGTQELRSLRALPIM